MSVLSDWMEKVIGSSYCTALNWTSSGGSFDFAVSETLRLLSLSSEPDTLTDKIYAVGKFVIWDQVVIALGGNSFDVSSDGSSYKMSQSVEWAIKQRKLAAVDANRLMENVVVKHHIGRSHHHDHDWSHYHDCRYD